jgi:hypothetical protein
MGKGALTIMKNIVLAVALALGLAGCATFAPDSGYRGLNAQPPHANGDCWVLGNDNAWRRCG